MQGHKTFIIGIMIATISLLLDQLTKTIVILNYGETSRIIAEITSFFNLVLVWNRGISFGMFSNHPEWMPLILMAISTGITIFLIIWLYRSSNILSATALGLIIGGAIGNIIDRVLYGAVIDFLDFHIMSYHWPAFNIADASIFIGVALLLIETIIEPKHTASKTD